MNLDQLITQPEGSTLDFKRDLSSLQKVVKTIAAISNTANGTVIVGVDDDKTVVGLKDPLKDEERLARAIADSIEPLLLVNIKHASRANQSVLVVDVPFSPRPYYLRAEGPETGVYVRQGSTNTHADPATITELRRLAASQSFDLEAVPAVPDDDLDQARLKEAFSGALSSSKLRTLGIACQYSGRQVATRAGVILFGTDEQRREHARDARMRCAAFRGIDKSEFIDRAPEFDDLTVLEALAALDIFLRRNLRSGAAFGDGLRRRNIDEYHRESLRELVVNAIAHANYASAGTPISVQLFADRLEVISPGRFPPGTTVQSFKEGMSKIRNRGIADVLHHLSIMETWGSGYSRIRLSFAQGYPEPTWQEVGGSVKVVVPVHPHYATGMTDTRSTAKRQASGTRRDRRQDITEYLKPLKQDASVGEIAQAIGLKPRQTRIWLERMEREGTITVQSRAATDPNRRYRLSK
ncbi:MAG: RNA-binding domain-containing protein [Solirubrobacteraceae bacterium]